MYKRQGHALDSLRRLAAKGAIAGFVAGDEMTGFAQYVDEFNKKIERHVSKQGWFREPPAAAAGRWYARGGIALAMGIVIGVIAFSLPSGGLTVVGLALAAAGVALMIIARAMPARTMAGAMIYAMLAAYRRTLQKTMEQARSMEEVVQRAQLDWLETPDQAVVWGVALGLQAEVEEVIERSARDAQAGDLTHGPWLPAWYGSHASSSGGGGWSGVAPGLFSASAIPSFGGMMAALGTVGNAPSSSGSSGGFSGGGSGGGGGGGSGGGF